MTEQRGPYRIEVERAGRGAFFGRVKDTLGRAVYSTPTWLGGPDAEGRVLGYCRAWVDQRLKGQSMSATNADRISDLNAAMEAAIEPIRNKRRAEANEAHDRYLAEVQAINERCRDAISDVQAPYLEQLAKLRAEDLARPPKAFRGAVDDGCGSPLPNLSPALLDGGD